MKKNKSIAGAVVIIVIGLLLIIAGLLIPLLETKKVVDRKDLYVVAGVEKKYGIAKADGSMLVNAVYVKILVGKDIAYLKSDTNSYLYNLKDYTSVTLDGMESDVIFPKDKDGNYIDKYILQFGTDEKNSIYRVVDSKGKKVLDKDYASIYEAYIPINASLSSDSKYIDQAVIGKDNTLIKQLHYLTEDSKYQCVIKTGEGLNVKYGIIDEAGKQIVPLEYTSIETDGEINPVVIAKKENKIFVIPSSGTPIEIEQGFEVDIKGEGYIVQKRGSTANKLYNLKGEAILDKIFNLPIQAITLNSKTTSYLFIDDGKDTWSMYDLKDLKKPVKKYTKVNSEYIKNKKPGEISTSFIYVKGGVNYMVDLETFEEYKLGIASAIIAPLEPGYVLGIK